MGEVVSLPTSKTKVVSPQQAGRELEKRMERKYAMKRHPASGAMPSWVADLSDDEILVEAKYASGEQHTIKLSVLLDTLHRAQIEHKEAFYTIYWPKADITIEGRIRRGEP